MSSKKTTNDDASNSKNNRSANSEENVADPSTSDDRLFEPSLDMMVNDFDDESTLELEEKMASTEAQDPNAELDDLQREGEMPIEELLAMYNCVPPQTQKFTSSGSSRRRSKTSRNAGIDKTLMPPPEVPKDTPEASTSDSVKDETTERADKSEAVSTDIEVNTITEKESEEKVESDESKEISTESSKDEIKEIDAKTIEKADEPQESKKDVEEHQESKPEVKDVADADIELTKDDQSDVENDNDTDEKPQDHKSEDNIERIDETERTDETLDEDEDESEEESELKKLYPETYKTNEPRMLRATSHSNSDDEGAEDEEEEDNEYSPEEDEFKKKIMVGSEYQAQIPEGLCQYDDALPYENEDKLVWDPSQLQECDIESYLQKASIPVIVGSPSSNSPASPTSQSSTQKPLVLPNGAHLRDDEGSLFLLLQCGHNTEEALRRRRLNATLPQTAVAAATAANQTPTENTLWSEEECRNFESGLRVYRKDFHAIQQSKVRTRSVSELVQFYYLWKKTERHDIFANKARLEKKKYNLHPGLTDYMDRFLEEQENNGGISINNSSNDIAMGTSHGNGNENEHTGGDRSMSPIVNSLLYTDCKRQRMSE